MDRISVEHKDLSGSSHLALNKSGTLGLIVGRLSMGLVNLDKPEVLINRVKRNTSKYEVEEIQFSRGSETLCAVAAGKKVGKLIAIAHGLRTPNEAFFLSKYQTLGLG